MRTMALNNLINQLVRFKDQYRSTLSFKDRTAIIDTVNALEKSISLEDTIERVRQLAKDY